jgi:queuine tRNA-ribosyltransferase
MSFEIQARSGAARAGRLMTPHGVVHTPVFMPVGTQATVKSVPQQMLEELGVEILLGNTYHLYLRPGADLMRRLGGLHAFMAWDRAILTDSGGFQVFSLAALRKLGEEGAEFRSHLDGSVHRLSPEKSIAVQLSLGADIMMAFDECTEYPADRARARASMELTLRWAQRCRQYFADHKEEIPWKQDHRGIGRSNHPVIGRSGDRVILEPTPGDSVIGRLVGQSGDPAILEPTTTPSDHRITGSSDHPMVPALFGIVQGGMYTDLRAECADRLVEMDFPGYAIGGLSVGEPRELTYEMVARTVERLPAGKPRYVMGVGTPEEIVAYARLGVDMMDCVLPTRAARHGLLLTSEGRVNIKGARYAEDTGPPDPHCGCPVCGRYSRAYLRHLYTANEVLAQVLNTVHNLAYYLDTMRRVRQAISFGEFTTARVSVSSGQPEDG